MSGGITNVPKRVLCNCLNQLLILVIGIALTMHMSKVGKVSNQNTQTISAIVEDWNTIPFTKVEVTDDKCAVSQESVFKLNWGGTEQGCLVNKIDTWGFGTTQTVMTTREYDNYISSRSSSTSSSSYNHYGHSSSSYNSRNQARMREPCMPISMVPPKTQDEFYDMRFCGTRGGSPFEHVVRPKPTGKMGKDQAFECPSNFVRCSQATNLNNTVCVPSGKKDNQCPMTFFKFIVNSEVARYQNDTANYKVQEVDDDISLVTSRTQGDSLPITSFKLEEKPCLDSRDKSQSISTQFYPLERDRTQASSCRVVEQFNEAFDTRYINSGLQITEFEVQDESDVLDSLQKLPNYYQYVSDQTKKSIKYTFWTRPAISWKLECDDKHPRSSVVSAADYEADSEPLHEGAVTVMISIAYICGFLASFVIFVLFVIGKMRRRDCGSLCHRGFGGCCLGIQFILFGICTLIVFNMQSELGERAHAMKQLAFVNACGDKYTQVPKNFVPEIEEASGMILFCVIGVSCQLIFALVGLLGCVCAGHSEEPDDASDDEQKYDQLPQE